MASAAESGSAFDAAAAAAFLEPLWESSVLPTLCEFVKIPNRTPGYGMHEEARNLLDQAADLLVTWVAAQDIPGLTVERITLPGTNALGDAYSPLVFGEIPASGEGMESHGTIMLYGHLDKQPPFTGWSSTGPYEPDIRTSPFDGRRKLYGRGGADDGYSTFAAVSSLLALRAQGLAHARVVLVVEGSEESGSRDLPDYLDSLRGQIGPVNMVICLDSMCGSYDQFWLTTSLRGALTAELKVGMLSQGVHSGDASGVVPDTFRIARSLVSRVEDENTGTVKLDELWVDIPPGRVAETEAAAATLGEKLTHNFPFLPGAQPVDHPSIAELQLNRTWRPQLAVVGAAGLPALADAGPVLRPETTLKLSLRTPPTLDAPTAAQGLKRALEQSPPYGATVEVKTAGALGSYLFSLFSLFCFKIKDRSVVRWRFLVLPRQAKGG
jgi:acetylornithine deacetylase/succinyl-diaminopimelate desuccinylase-like protein